VAYFIVRRVSRGERCYKVPKLEVQVFSSCRAETYSSVKINIFTCNSDKRESFLKGSDDGVMHFEESCFRTMDKVLKQDSSRKTSVFLYFLFNIRVFFVPGSLEFSARFSFVLEDSSKVKQSRYTPWRRLREEEVQLLLILDLGTRWW
jgi:hypothetical protein